MSLERGDVNALRYEHNRLLNHARTLVWIELSLAVAIVFVALVARAGVALLFWVEVVVVTPASWLLVFLLERSGGRATGIVAIVFTSVVDVALIAQLVYTAVRVARCRAEQACEHLDARVAALLITILYLLVDTLLIVVAARLCAFDRRKERSSMRVVRVVRMLAPGEEDLPIDEAAEDRAKQQQQQQPQAETRQRPATAGNAVGRALLQNAQQNKT